ncbi:MAG: hypothetical protein J6Y82_11560 [Bacteroidales bacterium]|nr:hypothetical protein [Bacteroidales bacterium]
MRTTLISTCLCAFAFANATAQFNAEKYINMVPTLPSVNDLTEQHFTDDGELPASIQRFENSLNSLTEQVKSITEGSANTIKEASISEADADLKNKYGVSLDEITNMSDDELSAFANKALENALGNMSINIPTDVLTGSRELSESEINSIAESAVSAQMNAMGLNLSAQDIKAMENMSDAEIEAYMKKKGIGAAQAQPKPTTKASTAAAYEASTKLISAGQNISGLVQSINQQKNAAHAKYANIWKTKYKQRYDAQYAVFQKCIAEAEDNYSEATQKRYEAAKANLNNIEREFYNEIYPQWTQETQKWQNTIKQDGVKAAKELEKSSIQANKAMGNTMGNAINNSGIYQMGIFELYTDASRDIVEFDIRDYIDELENGND